MGTILITGANRGIGLALARTFAHRGDDVIAVVRRSSPELDALGVRIESEVDVTDDEAVRRLAERLQGVSIDVLVNCAGVLSTSTLERPDYEGIRRQFEINAIGPLRVTVSLLPRLHPGSKVILITSRMGSIGDNGSGGSYGYRMSKAALNIAGVSLARDLQGQGIAVGILHPGMVATDMTSRFGQRPETQRPEDSAARLVARIDELTLDTTGSFRHANGEPLPW